MTTPLLRLRTTSGGHVIVNVNHLVSATTAYDDVDNVIGSAIELATGKTIEVTKELDDLWDML